MKNNYELIFETIVGSQSYGTAIEGSDEDRKGIYIQPLEDILSFSRYKPQIEINKDHSIFEVRRFLELLKTANPTMLELIYSPEDCILTKKPIFDVILKHRQKFLTKMCKNSFGGYAVQQIKKASGLNKKANWEADKITRKTPLDFLKVFDSYSNSFRAYKEDSYTGKQCLLVSTELPNVYNLYRYPKDISDRLIEKGFKVFGIVGEDSTEVRFKSKEILYEFDKVLGSSNQNYYRESLVHYNKDAYTKHCKDYNSYQEWLKEKNSDRYGLDPHSGLFLNKKNIMHLRRLLDTAFEIAQEGTLNVRRSNREELLKIRRGEVDLKSVIDKAEEDIIKLDEIYEKCDLPEEVSIDLIDDILIELRTFKG